VRLTLISLDSIYGMLIITNNFEIYKLFLKENRKSFWMAIL